MCHGLCLVDCAVQNSFVWWLLFILVPHLQSFWITCLMRDQLSSMTSCSESICSEWNFMCLFECPVKDNLWHCYGEILEVEHDHSSFSCTHDRMLCTQSWKRRRKRENLDYSVVCVMLGRNFFVACSTSWPVIRHQHSRLLSVLLQLRNGKTRSAVCWFTMTVASHWQRRWKREGQGSSGLLPPSCGSIPMNVCACLLMMVIACCGWISLTMASR